MKLTTKINKILHPWMQRYVRNVFQKSALRIERKHPELFSQIDNDLVEKHLSLWSPSGIKIDDKWLRFFVNLTGVADFRFCPPTVFYPWVERILNDCDSAGSGPEEKNDLWRYLPAGYEPDVILRYIRGSFYDGESRWVSESAAQDIMDVEKGDLVGKPCRSSGGSGVELFAKKRLAHENKEGNRLTTKYIAKQDNSYVVQRKLKQDAFGSSFNSSSINTVRLVATRKPWDGEVIVCRSMMRIGVSDALVDNMSKGGLCVPLSRDGKLNKYGFDYDGARFDKHPVSNIFFNGLQHPHYFKMVEAAKEILSRFPFYNMASFDFIARDNGSICCVEINARSQGIIQSQYGFGGLFGEDTERVVQWCAEHVSLDSFNHIRTWY